MKRTLSLVLALLMVISLFAVANADDANCFAPYEETVTLTTGKSLQTGANFVGTDTQADNTITRAALEDLNIKVDLLWESDEYNSKISLCIASDDLPDMFVAPNYVTYASLLENEMLADLSGLLETYASDFIYNTIWHSYQTTWMDAVKTSDGGIYCIASPNYYYDGSYMMWMRQDWLDAVGKTAPTTLDELHDVLVAFKDAYGVTMPFQKDPLAAYNSLFSAWGIMGAMNSYPSIWHEDAEGKVVYGTLTNETKEAIKLLNAWYEEGLIDPEFPTYATADVAAKFNVGEAGILFGPWWVSFQLGDSLQLEGCEVSPYNVPADANGKVNLLAPANYGSMLLVNANCANPEAVVKLHSFQFEVYGNGGGSEFTPKYAEEIKEVRAINTSWSALFPCGGVNAGMSDTVLRANYATHDLLDKGEYSRDDYTDSQRMVAEKTIAYMNGETDDMNGWIYQKGYLEAGDLFQAENAVLINQAFAQQTESMGELWASLETLEDTTIMGMIVGEIDIDAEWDKFVDQWYAQGGDIITEEVNEMCGK